MSRKKILTPCLASLESWILRIMKHLGANLAILGDCGEPWFESKQQEAVQHRLAMASSCFRQCKPGNLCTGA